MSRGQIDRPADLLVEGVETYDSVGTWWNEFNKSRLQFRVVEDGRVAAANILHLQLGLPGAPDRYCPVAAVLGLVWAQSSSARRIAVVAVSRQGQLMSSDEAEVARRR